MQNSSLILNAVETLMYRNDLYIHIEKVSCVEEIKYKIEEFTITYFRCYYIYYI